MSMTPPITMFTKIPSRMGSGTPQWLAALLIFSALLLGLLVPMYVGAMGESLARLTVLPALMILAFALWQDRLSLLALILLLRASGDLLLESTKFSIGSAQIGIGGVINAFIILIALLLAFEKPNQLERRMLYPWLGFLIIGLVGVAQAPISGDAIRLYLTLISYLAVFVSAFFYVREVQDFRRVIWLIVCSSFLPVGYAIISIAMHGGVTGMHGDRLHSTFAHPNIFAFYLTLLPALIKSTEIK